MAETRPLSRPKIAVINDVAGVGVLQAQILNRGGYQADFIDLPKPGAAWPSWAKWLIMPVRLARYVPTVLRLRRADYDWLHIHYTSQGFIGLIAGKPYFLHVHSSDMFDTLPVWLRRLTRARARGIFYVTPELIDDLREFRGKSYLLPNPLEPAFLTPTTIPPQLQKVLIFTRLYLVKGPDEIFGVAAELSKCVSLTAISWGPLTVQYRRDHGSIVRFIDRVPHGQVLSLLERFDAVIGQMRSGVLGLSELEAMARGRVVFMNVDESLYGDDPPPVISVSKGTALVAAVRRLHQNPDEMVRLGNAGREWVLRHHGHDGYLRMLRRVYETSLGTFAE